MIEQEKAEQQKKELFYDPVPYEGYDENGQLLMEEEPCEYGFSEDCVEPSLRNTNCCFECWLYNEVDDETKKQAKECPDKCEDCSSLEVEEDSHGLRYPICHKKKDGKK